MYHIETNRQRWLKALLLACASALFIYMVAHRISVSDKRLKASISRGDVVGTRWLLEHGADPNARWFTGSGPTDWYRSLYDTGFRNLVRPTALINVVEADIRDVRQAQIVSALLSFGADVNAENCLGETALIVATKNNESIDIIRALIKWGADVNKFGRGSSPAIVYAMIHNRADIVTALLEAGAKEIPIDAHFVRY